MMNFLHSRKTGYFLLVIAVLALEIFLGWRASIMYAAILAGQIGLLELNVIKWLVFFAVAVFGFTLSVHRHYGAEAIVDHMLTRGKQVNGWAGIGTAMGIIVLHDLAATIYTVFGNGKAPTFPLIAATLGMCALCFVPFLMSRMMRALHDGVEAEQEAGHQRKMQQVQRNQQLAALRKSGAGPLSMPTISTNGYAPVNGQNGGASNGAATFQQP
ncbi:MAG TPA: hypothetical protein VKT82_24700 [Ktedonobacterales bacterium]|nr:hypothetical protein [Ktedonobacterales bacterium]